MPKIVSNLELLEVTAMEQGWNLHTQVLLLLEFIDCVGGHPDTFRRFIDNKATFGLEEEE